MNSGSRSQLKTGRRPVAPNTKSLKEGETLFEEGTTGREVYIIQSGELGVYKKTSEGEVELARVPEKGVIGEMSLLDRAPRSATIRATKDSTLIVVNESVFNATLKVAPTWLTTIVKIVVSRLRDANKRIGMTVLRNKEYGLMSLISLLLKESKYEFSSMSAIAYDMVIVEAYYVCRLKKKDTQRLIESVSKKGVISVEEDTDHKKHICFPDMTVLALYLEYLTLKSQNRNFKELSLSEESVAILSNIAYLSQKSGTETDGGVELKMSILMADMKDKGDSSRVEKQLMDLRRKGILNIFPRENDSVILFDSDYISRIKKIKDWILRFEMDV